MQHRLVFLYPGRRELIRESGWACLVVCSGVFSGDSAGRGLLKAPAGSGTRGSLRASRSGHAAPCGRRSGHFASVLASSSEIEDF